MLRSVKIHVAGIVQGVGFRPFVYRIAKRNQVCGWVLNASDGVHIQAEGDEALVASFLSDLELDAPAAARIDRIDVEDVPLGGFAAFEIRDSQGTTPGRTGISSDLATCPKCLAELLDPANRRFHYPFINCTDCGPRFTITDALPYDRPGTSMRAFDMCPDCAREYADPADRRFHAQPDACFDCGPQLRLLAPDGAVLMEVAGADTDARRGASDAIVERAAELLREGRILAIKGLGGFHLACNACDEDAVGRLRSRKKRSNKPFAVMVQDVEAARALCRVSDAEAATLEGPAAPIVLLERDPGAAAAIAPGVAGPLHELGIMLPCTPLQHLLVRLVDFPLVMTSGNVSEEPIVCTGADAVARLGSIADAILDNDRPIVSRYDDSVLRIVDGQPEFVRRARGFAPKSIGFPFDVEGDCKPGFRPAILGTGPEQKATFALAESGRAYVSQHIGDLENAETMDAWLDTRLLFERLFSLDPVAIAHDRHPEYLSTKWARANAGTRPLTAVQHHHAHIAAVLGEHIAAGDIPADEKVLGLALDGTGYGTDGTIWGGELLLADCTGFERIGHLRELPMPGGAQAIRHPARMAAGTLLELELADHPGAASLVAHLGEDIAVIERMVKLGINTPVTSSAGRLFDAASALTGTCLDATFDGEAPMLLEAALYGAWDSQNALPDGGYPFALRGNATPADPLVIDPQPAIAALLDDMAASAGAPGISLRFHAGLVRALAEACDRARAATGIGTVALSGGVFANRFVATCLPPLLCAADFTVLQHIALPPNDGCIAYGQAVVAAARMAI